jgi:hypothetical protein
MLGQYYMQTGISAFAFILLAAITGLFGRSLRKALPKMNVLKVHKASALIGAFSALLHVLGIHGY